jgi:hypothetical protein
MMGVIHFSMIVELNELLKEKNIEYSLHSVGGCSSCGLELRQEGDKYPIDEIITIINDYLYSKFQKVEKNQHNPNILDVLSRY